jgi:hypothetical protein
LQIIGHVYELGVTLLSLRISAIIFCVFWTTAMLWCSAPLDIPKIAGVLSALAWLWIMTWWLNLEVRPRSAASGNAWRAQ